MRLSPLALAGALLLPLFSPGSSMAGDLTYEPVNPAFGGNPLNGSFLLNTAQAQRPEEDQQPFGASSTQTTPINSFASSLQRRLLSQLSGQIVQSIYGENALPSGTFVVNDTQVAFNRTGDTVNLTIEDLLSGETTSITVPASVQ